jgi:hypothetical protein
MEATMKIERIVEDIIRNPVIIRQIVGRHHVSTPFETVLRSVKRKLIGGTKTFNAWNQVTKDAFVAAVKSEHDRNFALFAAVQAGRV